MRSVVPSARCVSTLVALTAEPLVTSVRLCGASADTTSTCIASRSGSRMSRNSAPCAVVTGNFDSEPQDLANSSPDSCSVMRNGLSCWLSSSCMLVAGVRFEAIVAMGHVCARLRGNIPKKNVRVLMVGLDAVGKTTILYKLTLGEVLTTAPTDGFNEETVECQNLKFTVWDVRGQEKVRRYWRQYFQGPRALVFVVDSTDQERVDVARLELKKLLSEDEMRNVALLVFANKQDLPNAMLIEEVVDKLELRKLHGRQWFAQPCCATTGDGLVVDGACQTRQT